MDTGKKEQRLKTVFVLITVFLFPTQKITAQESKMNLNEAIMFAANPYDSVEDEPSTNIYAQYGMKILDFITTTHVFHWSTASAQLHQTSGDLYEQLEEAVDEFMEMAIGSGVVSKESLLEVANSTNKVNYTQFEEQLCEICRSTTQMIEYTKMMSSSGFALMDKIGDIQEILTKYKYLSKQE